MSEPDETFADGLPTIKSQRRFLEVMSLICAAYYWFHLQIVAQSNLGSVPVHIGSTRYVITTLWIGLAWAAFRYGQQLYRSRADLLQAIRVDYRVEFALLAHRIMRKHLLSVPGGRFGPGKPYFQGFAGARRFVREEARRFDVNHKEVAPNLPEGLGADSHTVLHVVFDWRDKHSGRQMDYEFGISRGATLRLCARAWVATLFRLPAILDYSTPVLMLIFAMYSLVLATMHRPLEAICV